VYINFIPLHLLTLESAENLYQKVNIFIE
jgi:hypothetical protein